MSDLKGEGEKVRGHLDTQAFLGTDAVRWALLHVLDRLDAVEARLSPVEDGEKSQPAREETIPFCFHSADIVLRVAQFLALNPQWWSAQDIAEMAFGAREADVMHSLTLLRHRGLVVSDGESKLWRFNTCLLKRKDA